MASLHDINRLGQSIWYDNLRRALLEHGEMQALIEAGVSGVTSNPTIFEKAIAGSADYDAALRAIAPAGRSASEIFETLAVEDIRRTADLLRPIFDRTAGGDGYVSLEVSPTLAHDTAGTTAEAKRLFAAVGRPNLMIKIPGTVEGVPAITETIAAGINVNVTLLFSLRQYEAAANAYLAGLEQLMAKGGDLRSVASVASFFVSRVDTAVDAALAKAGTTDLQGTIAIANAKLAYRRFHQIFSGDRWDRLAARGARLQRPLWASTGTKDPHYPDTLYVDGLIGPDTVNTMPPATLAAVQDHGIAAPTLDQGIDDAESRIGRLKNLGIDLDAITAQLQDEGVASFATAFETLLSAIRTKQDRLLGEIRGYVGHLGSSAAAVDRNLRELREQRVISRVWAHDYTVWKHDPAEISNRLGWLHSPETMQSQLPAIADLVAEVREAGYTQALLLGMGGSSLAPEVFRNVFGASAGYLDLAVLDSTVPGAVLEHALRLDPAKTLFIVSTKSGGTVETFSFFKFFYNWTLRALGRERTGEHFIAITDPGSALADTAKRYGFRATFLNDPNIGGRYSALSCYGIVPAALVGVDVGLLLDRAATMACNCEAANSPVGGDNSGAWLGAVLGELAVAGRDKVTLVASPPIAPIGPWIEQLIAESTGKDGTGILPVTGEALEGPEAYANDRLFAYLKLAGDDRYDAAIQRLIAASHPVVEFTLHDRSDIASEMFRWEFATALAGRRLGINPFDQPNVEAAKALAREMVAAYENQGSLPQPAPKLRDAGIAAYGQVAGSTIGDALRAFLDSADPGENDGKGRSYVALQAYVQPTAETTDALQALRTTIQTSRKLATTVGYGPRFLHSTGQLHKGDAGHGLFIQFIADDPQDVPIPNEAGEDASAISFGVLKTAQVLGDTRALENAHRRVIRFALGSDIHGGLQRLKAAFG